MSSPNTILLSERFAEIAAVSAAEQLVKRLRSQALEPSTKRFANTRSQRLSAWLELEAAARAQIGVLKAAPQAARRKAAKKEIVYNAPAAPAAT